MKNLRKFGLQSCDLPTTLWNLAVLLRALTLNIDKRHTKRPLKIFYVLTALSSACYVYVFLGSMFWFVFVRCRETGDLVAASVVYSVGACSITGVSKLAYMSIHSGIIIDIVGKYLACDSLEEPGSRFSTNLLKALRVVKTRAVGFWLFLVINGLIYIATAVLRPGRHFVEDLVVIYGLEPMFETPNYQIAFVMMSAGMYFGIPAETNTSAFLTILAGYTEAQMLALSEELENLWTDAEHFYQQNEGIKHGVGHGKEKIINKYVKEQLKIVVKRHINIIYLAGELENVFRQAIAVEFGFLTSALIAELLGGFENTYLQLPYTLTQLAMDCFTGQRLIDASLVLETAVYSCGWENFNKSNQRTIYLMLLNSQKTLTLSVGGITILSFTCFMSVLKSIYSAYTTLRSRI